MRRDHAHTHPCQRCRVETACGGDLERNHDGFPEIVCESFDMHSHDDFLCEDCAEAIDNAEPGDPDGEDFRGGEAAAYEREQMIAAQKLK